MTERVTVRVGPDAAVLVLGTGRDRVRETAGILGRETVAGLGPQVVLLPLGMLAGAAVHAVLGVGTGAVVGLVGALALLEVLACWLVSGWGELTRPSRLEFAPPDAPARMRFVRLGVRGRWRPVTELGNLRVAHRIVAPVDGDPRPARETFTVRREAARPGTAPLSAYEVPGDPRRLVEQLGGLLAPAGLAVELRTDRYVRTRGGGPPVLVPDPPADRPAG
ncbi:hypothetical protein ACWC5I_46940 [Kitasatospora sp. NPDC001574]